jgi:putative SOS response-associated peptidase YedK
MCERYVIPERAEVEREFRLAHPWWRFSPSYNVATGRNVPVIRTHEGETEGVMLRWGLVPEWAEGDAARGSASHIAASEIGRSPVSRDAWSKGRRCILPLSGFYAWQLTPRRYRQPYFVRLADRPVFGIAALWDRTVAEEEDDVMESCAIIAVPANGLMTDLENLIARMPAILHRDDYETWLTGSAVRALTLLRPYPEAQMLAHPISPRVNSLKYDDADLIQPVGTTVSAPTPDAVIHAA